MSQGHVDVQVTIENTPEAVVAYVADVRNRPLFLGPLKSVTEIQGDPDGVGTKWKWVFASLGMEFEGIGECLRHEPGKLYSFKTEGGIASTWTYRAEPEGDGTKLTIDVDYDVPAGAAGRLPTGSIADQMKQAEAQRVAENLQVILSGD